MRNAIWIVTGKAKIPGAVETFEGAFQHLAHCEQSVRMTYSNTVAKVEVESPDPFTWKYLVKVDGALVATYTATEYVVRTQADHF